MTPGRLYPWLLLNASAAVWITFAGIHAGHNADSLVFGLASVFRWTPFFWKQDRIGLLTPLVTSPVTDPVANLVLQVGITTFAGLCVPLLTIEVLRPSTTGRVAATLANALMLALAPERVVSNWLYECNYPQAMALAATGLLLLNRSGTLRIVLAALCMGLACWIYLGVLAWLLPLVVARGVLRSGWRIDRRMLLELGLGTFGLAAGYAVMLVARSLYPDFISKVNTTFIAPSRWPTSWAGFAESLDALLGFRTWIATLFALAVVGRLAKRSAEPSPAVAATILTPVVAEFVFLGTQYWPTINDYHPRYLIGTLIGAGTLRVWLATAPLQTWINGHRVSYILAGLALFAAATARFGWPASDRPRTDLKALCDRAMPELSVGEFDAVGGNYWATWPAVFGANADGRTVMIYGIAERANVLRPLWERTHPDGMRVAVPATADDRRRFLDVAADVGLSPPVMVADRGLYEIYFTRPNR